MKFEIRNNTTEMIQNVQEECRRRHNYCKAARGRQTEDLIYVKSHFFFGQVIIFFCFVTVADCPLY